MFFFSAPCYLTALRHVRIGEELDVDRLSTHTHTHTLYECMHTHWGSAHTVSERTQWAHTLYEQTHAVSAHTVWVSAHTVWAQSEHTHTEHIHCKWAHIHCMNTEWAHIHYEHTYCMGAHTEHTLWTHCEWVHTEWTHIVSEHTLNTLWVSTHTEYTLSEHTQTIWTHTLWAHTEPTLSTHSEHTHYEHTAHTLCKWTHWTHCISEHTCCMNTLYEWACTHCEWAHTCSMNTHTDHTVWVSAHTMNAHTRCMSTHTLYEWAHTLYGHTLYERTVRVNTHTVSSHTLSARTLSTHTHCMNTHVVYVHVHCECRVWACAAGRESRWVEERVTVTGWWMSWWLGVSVDGEVGVCQPPEQSLLTPRIEVLSAPRCTDSCSGYSGIQTASTADLLVFQNSWRGSFWTQVTKKRWMSMCFVRRWIKKKDCVCRGFSFRASSESLRRTQFLLPPTWAMNPNLSLGWPLCLSLTSKI